MIIMTFWNWINKLFNWINKHC